MSRARTVCPKPGCPTLTPGGPCDAHKRAPDTRPASHLRGYGSAHRNRFRPGVLQRHPTCVLCQRAPATRADHWPLSRKELVAKGLDPDDPKYGRGLCASCDGRQTQRRQPGGWHAAQRHNRR